MESKTTKPKWEWRCNTRTGNDFAELKNIWHQILSALYFVMIIPKMWKTERNECDGINSRGIFLCGLRTQILRTDKHDGKCIEY